MLRDESTVLADDHHCRDRRATVAVARARLLDLDASILAHGPLAVVAAWATSRAAGFQRTDDFLLVAVGDSFVAGHYRTPLDSGVTMWSSGFGGSKNSTMHELLIWSRIRARRS